MCDVLDICLHSRSGGSAGMRSIHWANSRRDPFRHSFCFIFGSSFRLRALHPQETKNRTCTQHHKQREQEQITKTERFNGEVRDRGKVMRGLKKIDTPILTGYQMFHNYIRMHEGLDGKTPAEACWTKGEGENKWLTSIQNASKKS
jgi:hypothetical protein